MKREEYREKVVEILKEIYRHRQNLNSLNDMSVWLVERSEKLENRIADNKLTEKQREKFLREARELQKRTLSEIKNMEKVIQHGKTIDKKMDELNKKVAIEGLED